MKSHEKFLDVVRWLFQANKEELAAVGATLSALHSREEEKDPSVPEFPVRTAVPEPTYVHVLRSESGQFGEFKGATNGPKWLRGPTSAPPLPAFVYRPRAAWVREMWTLLRTSRTSGLKYSPEELAKKVGSTRKLVGMALLNLFNRPGSPLKREKRERTYFYWVKS